MRDRFISPLTWVGGKSKQWPLIKSYFPKDTKNINYIELFFGGGSVGLNALRDNLFDEYIFNDLNSQLIHFWNQLLIDNKYSNLYSDLFFPKLKNVEEAVKRFNIISNSFQSSLAFIMGNNLKFNGFKDAKFSQKRLEQNWNLNKRERIKLCHDLLKNNSNRIYFENEDYISIIEHTLHKPCFYYLDPPYYKINRIYEHDFKDSDWINFTKWLKIITDQDRLFCLSINDCLETREMFKEYNIYPQEWKYTSNNVKKSPVRMGKELIITNYEVIKNGF